MPQSVPMLEMRSSRNDEQSQSLTEHKVVINLSSGNLLKGYLACTNGLGPEAIFGNSDVDAVVVRLLDSDNCVIIPISDVKAIFFVKSFRGDAKRKTLRFYSNGPDPGPIWAEIRFNDSEILEGKVDNSVQHLMGDGLLVYPTDSGGNNVLMYVNKKAVRSYRVLGVRSHRK